MKKLIFFLLILYCSVLSAQPIGWSFRNPQPQNDFYSIKFFNQNTGYAIGSGGTILKTNTGDNQWISQSSGTTKNLFGSYFFDMNHGFVVGDSGIVLNTVNGGNSWTPISSGTLNALRSITFVNSNTGFAVGDNGLILRTINGGLNWTSSNPAAIILNNVFFIDVNTGFACGENGTLLKTINSGSNWTSQTFGSGSMMNVYFINSLTGFIAVRFGVSLKTSDGGTTWNPVLSGQSGSLYSIKFVDQNTGFAVGNGCPIYKTTNQGLNWIQWCSGQLFGNYTFRDLCPIDTNTVFISGEKGWVLKSIGTYISQSSKPLGGTKSNFNSISFINENTGCVIGNEVYSNTINAGMKWDISCAGTNSWFETSSHVTNAWMFSPQSAYRLYFIPGHASPYSYSIDNSTDGGITWTGVRGYSTVGSLGGVCEIQGITYLSSDGYYSGPAILKNSGSGWINMNSPASVYLGPLSFANQNTGIVIGYTSTNWGILRTTDGGGNWNYLPTGSKRENTICMLPTGRGYIAGDSSFMQRSSDFGATWNLLPTQNLKYYQMQFVNDNTGWVIAQTNSAPYYNKLYYTSNGGSNFMQIQSLGNFYPNGMSFVNSLTGYVCGDSGVVLKTTDAGLTFVNPTSNLSPSQFNLSQNYPNPFNPTTNIKFDLPKPGFVKLTIYDALGREVTTLVNSEMKAGSYNTDWDASSYSSGIYFYKLETGDFAETKKMVLVK